MMPMRPPPTWAITSSIALPPVAASGRAVSMQHRDDRVAFRINNEDHAIHAFPIGGWNAVGQSSEARRLTVSDRQPLPTNGLRSATGGAHCGLHTRFCTYPCRGNRPLPPAYDNAQEEPIGARVWPPPRALCYRTGCICRSPWPETSELFLPSPSTNRHDAPSPQSAAGRVLEISPSASDTLPV
jgi:hypothetical protein